MHYKQFANGKPAWQPQWAEVGGKRIYFRSKWEKNYACYLEWLKVSNHIREWKHESKTFWFDAIKRGVRSYLPDFEVVCLDSTIIYYEVKGYMDSKSATKIKRMAKYHPEVILKVIDKDWFKSNSPKMKIFIKGWS
jgi:hypothetical protein